jgi:hypothetical protein
MENRLKNLQHWLTNTCGLGVLQLEPMPGDASFRRYFRVKQPNKTYVVMDAVAEKTSCVPFTAIAAGLRSLGLQAPEIIAFDKEQGFILLTDFGDQLFLKTVNIHNAEKYYGIALDTLAVLQACRDISGWRLPPFTSDFMRNELNLFKEWFLQKHVGLTLSVSTTRNLAQCFNFLAESAALQPQVFMHRDYHSANLMVLPDDQLGILDFQDAFIGPLTYDLVSLLRDCYIDWPNEMVTKLALQYRDRLVMFRVSDEEFLRWLDLMGLQRHLKALLTFSRKYWRDGNSNYLQYIPRTMKYITMISQRYDECKPLVDCFNLDVQKTATDVPLCAQ